MVTKETLVSELIKEEPKAAAILAEEGLRCIGCSSLSGETIESAAKEHGIDPVLLLRKLNFHLYGRLV